VIAALLRRAIGNAIADHAAEATRDRRIFFDRGPGRCGNDRIVPPN
jgi:hypothetical protein